MKQTKVGIARPLVNFTAHFKIVRESRQYFLQGSKG